MKFALFGVAALAATAFVTPALAQAVIEDPGYCAQSTRMQTAKTLDRATRIPMAATIGTTGRTATRPWSIVGTVTIGYIVGNGEEAASKEVRPAPTNRTATGSRVCLRSIRQSLHHSAAQ